MAVVIARQKMTVRHSEGEHTIFPSRDPQSLPDHLLSHSQIKGAIASKWIDVLSEPAEAEQPESVKNGRKKKV